MNLQRMIFMCERIGMLPELVNDVKVSMIDLVDSDINNRFFSVFITYSYEETNNWETDQWLIYDTVTKQIYDYSLSLNQGLKKKYENLVQYRRNLKGNADKNDMMTPMITVIMDEPESINDKKFNPFFLLLWGWTQLNDNREKLAKEIDKMIVDTML